VARVLKVASGSTEEIVSEIEILRFHIKERKQGKMNLTKLSVLLSKFFF